MSEYFFQWWVWAAGALILGILEVIAPAFVLLGFAIGAAVVAILLVIGGPALVGGTVPWMLVIFALASLAAWIGLKKTFKLKHGQVKIWDTDIND
ncbi:NfeD family protein [Parasulfitobacter algicola]|uniref:NfeD-like C-terminal domain-containing protein n=1 Tax=Parasulfitobacter algicola TaxID=2614809 RepID=A0ABX2IR04_9RHOB|nr:hypothetical protein [Sulfitobacter algicola]NSX53515.1 hypothetical protein [Sulfitobacter algicola]